MSFDPRAHIPHAIERLKAKSPQSISSADLISYVLPLPEAKDIRIINRFKQFLSVNPKVAYSARTNSYTYQPTLPVYNSSDLLSYLQQQETAQGLSVRDLKDGWPDVETAIDQLEAEHKLLVTRQKKDNRPQRVYADDPSLWAPLDADFKEMWEKITLPPPEEVIRSLEREKLNPAGQVDVASTTAPKVKKVKKVRRGAKITNVHMQDTFRDYSQQRPQAGN